MTSGGSLGPVLDVMRRTIDPYQLQALAQAVQVIGPRPSRPGPRSAPSSRPFARPPTPTCSPALAQAVQALSPKLTPDQIEAALGPLLEALPQGYRPSRAKGPLPGPFRP